MDKPTLKKIRLIVPGAIILVCMLPFGLSNLETISKAVPDSVFKIVLFILSAFLGVVYYSFNIRNLLWREVVHTCHRNIRARMIDPIGHEAAYQEVTKHLSDKEMMNIFYTIVDNDTSLTDRANDVRSNGAVLTSIIDAIIIIYFFAIVYIVTFLIVRASPFVWFTIIALLLQFVLWPMKRRVLQKHIVHEDEQLGMINQLYRTRVKTLLMNLERIE